MKIFEIASTPARFLLEARARIDHPEDILFDENGVTGATRALQAIEHTASDPAGTTTIKWDGSPAVIFGWLDPETFIVTDKAGIGAQSYDGKPTSGDALTAMIYNRKPDQPGRAEYASRFGSIYDLLKRATPMRPAGRLIQGDLLWMSNNDLRELDDAVEFQPNKVKYRIDKTSDLGRRIKRSQAGIAIHGYYPSVVAAASAEGEAKPATPESLKIKDSPGLVVLGPSTNISEGEKFKLPKAQISQVKKLLSSPAAQKIDDMLDPFNVGAMKISNLADLFKTYITFRAGLGTAGLEDAAEGFVKWVQSPASKLTANKQQNVLAHIKRYQRAYTTMWQIIAGLTELKHQLKDQFDQRAGGKEGQVQPANGHEGFVAVTPHGRIKLVNRPVFMKKGLK